MTIVTTPVGRIVWGNPLKGRPKIDNRTNQPVLDKTGQPVTEWAFGLAIDKQQAGEISNVMGTEAASIYPQGAPQNFSWKYKLDTDVDQNGVSYGVREGYPGCVVYAITTQIAPRVVRLVGGAHVDMTDGVKTGDYVRVGLDIKAHPPVNGGVPGLYINPLMVEFVGYGEEIFSGPDAATLFAQPAQLPPGASATPVASGPMPGGTPAGPMTQPQQTLPGTPPMQPAAQPMPQQQTIQPGQPVQPAHDFVQNATGGQIGQSAGPTQPGNAPTGAPGTAPLPGFPGQR